MEKRKLLIVDSSEEYLCTLSDSLRGSYQLRLCRDGMEALNIMRTFQPDLLVTELMLPGLDGLSLLQTAAAEGLLPSVLVYTYYFSEYITDALVRLNIDYAMQKPCNMDAIIARIRDLSGQLQSPLFTSPDPRTQISNVLISLGIPTKLHGYSYLRESILLMVRDMSQPITKELYPAVAKICNVSNPKLVERSIRSCIATAWQRRDEQVWQLYFPPDDSGQIPKPTNGDFISRLADYLLLQMDSQFEE